MTGERFGLRSCTRVLLQFAVFFEKSLQFSLESRNNLFGAFEQLIITMFQLCFLLLQVLAVYFQLLLRLCYRAGYTDQFSARPLRLLQNCLKGRVLLERHAVFGLFCFFPLGAFIGSEQFEDFEDNLGQFGVLMIIPEDVLKLGDAFLGSDFLTGQPHALLQRFFQNDFQLSLFFDLRFCHPIYIYNLRL